MDTQSVSTMLDQTLQAAQLAIADSRTYIQFFVIVIIYILSFAVAYKIRHSVGLTHNEPLESAHPVRKLGYRIGGILFPLIAIILLQISSKAGESLTFTPWLIETALAIAVLLFFNSLIRAFVQHQFAASLFRWVGLPILMLHLLGLLTAVTRALEEISLDVGNVSISAYGVARVLIFGSFLFWLGRASNTFGKAVIKKQASLDVPTKEVFSKLFEVSLFCIVMLLLLNIMGVNLTTLAVFGGAVGVGLGLGLQSIASNFISGIIILLDRSLTVGDFVELDDGQKGFVREFKMRYAVLETYDGKDILVPNEKFISSLMVNWTHKDPKQRYRVDFSVPYSTDVRSMVEFIKVAVAEHEQVISGMDVPFEERPDCEIDSFGDSGINMFVEFWMIGIDDGKNRVGGDLMLIILETLRENGIEIPFPQREVKIIDPKQSSPK
ncbi:mechanosensitive ion channel family protein [Paraglaciecola arctica]|uniref:mechanosensitive ion channel family protein n=1 Tax=Paraglaciecola arctica TaxID=1128911 RepID=UPI001C06769F|nr:mechanosensitive ion channel domain-containing protein [Paraglaciecola arctica]MBU3003743.1 mechanosensitive ion channel [Paraglaciecola arctica]